MSTITREIIDIHNHLLPGVDDGPKKSSESIQVLKLYASIGIKKVILTSHYIENSDFNKSVRVREKIFDKLKKESLDVELYLGNEVFITDNIINLKNDKEITTLNDSKYMLIEFPMYGFNQNIFSIIGLLRHQGIIPIIAHPERYNFLKEDISLIEEFLDYGCLFECNVGSLVGMYGTRAKRVFKYMLKNNYITFIASDIHSERQFPLIKKAYFKLEKMVSQEVFKDLTFSNPLKVLNDEEIKTEVKI